MSAPPPGLRIVRMRRLAAGNRYGGAARVEVIVAGKEAAPSAATVAAWLETIDAGLTFDFLRTVPTAGPADGDATTIAARLAVALQVRGRTLPFHVVPRGSDECLLVVATEAPTRLRVALETAFAVVPAIFAGRVPEDLRTRVAILLRPTWDHVEASEHWLLHDRLSARRIPWRGVSRYGDRLTQVGEGRHGRVVRITMTQRTSRRAANLGVRKDRASPILRRHGLPLPEQHVVTDADGAVAAALAIGPPVVVKRVDGRAGLDVHVGLADADAVRAAFAAIPRNAAAVVVERMLPGEDHRLLVIAGRLVAAARKEPPAVVGDGRSTIAELVARRNREPERLGSCAVLGPYPPMPEVIAHLAASGRTPASVPADGERVVVHRRGDLDSGIAVDVTDGVHPDNRDAVCQAAALLGLDVAGIDFITPDIGRPWHENGGGICEVNRMPGLLRHATIPGGPDVIGPLVAHILADRPMPTIPIAVLLGGEEADALAEATAGILAADGWPVGLATSRRFDAAGLGLVDPGPGNPRRVGRLVADPAVGAVIVALSADALLAHGFGHDRADLAVAVGRPASEALALLRRIGALVLERPDAAALARAMIDCDAGRGT